MTSAEMTRAELQTLSPTAPRTSRRLPATVVSLDLSGLDLSGFCFAPAKLNKMIVGAKLDRESSIRLVSGADLSDASLKGPMFLRRRCKGQNLTAADFSNSRLVVIDAQACVGASLVRANLSPT